MLSVDSHGYVRVHAVGYMLKDAVPETVVSAHVDRLTEAEEDELLRLLGCVRCDHA